MAQEMKLNEVELTNDISSNLNVICEDGGEWTRLNIKEAVASRSEMQELTSRLNQLSNPNLLINGDFQIWQRGTNFGGQSRNFFIADRWLVHAPSVRFRLTKIDKGISFSGLTAIWQNIESDLRNNNYTLSFILNGKKYAINDINFIESFNYYPLYNDETDEEIVSIQTIYYAEENYSRISFSLNHTDTYELQCVKLEQGSIATSFVPRLYAEELPLCQRYYYVLPYAQYIVSCGDASNTLRLHSDWVENNMRDSKTIRYSLNEGLSLANSAINIPLQSIVWNQNSIEISFGSDIKCIVKCDVTHMCYNNESSYIAIDAEIY